MRIALYNPPVSHYQGIRYQMNPPLGLPILASVLRDAGHYCEVADLEALGVTPDRLRDSFAKQRDSWPDVVGFTALTASARGAREAIAAVRGAGYGGTVVVGGVHATLDPNDAIAMGADLVVTGECEGNIASLLERKATGIHAGVAMPIASIPAPDWSHHYPAPSQYQGNFPKVGFPEAITMWSRGCPWHCLFCGNTIFRHQATRYRPVANIAAELKGLAEQGTKALFVYDDELVGGPMPEGWMGQLADAIAPLGLAWKAQGRCSVKHITPALMADMARGGCKVIMWGVESFSPKVLKAVRKGITPDDIWHTLRTAKEAGIQNWVFSMVGNYQETEDDLALTAECLRKAYLEDLVDYRQTTVVTALPGTELWEIQKRDGWWKPAPESGAQMHQVYADTPWLKADRIAYWLRRFDEMCPANHAGRAA